MAHDLNPVRKHSESKKAYHVRLKLAKKFFNKGKLIWHSLTQGTYVREEHGPIGTTVSNKFRVKQV